MISIKEVTELALESARIILQSGGTTNRCEKIMSGFALSSAITRRSPS